jgi:hypothetical protein
MTNADKLNRVKLLLGVTTDEEDTLLSGYLDLAKELIISHMCSVMTPSIPMLDVPSKYDGVQIMAVIAGYNLIGAEGEVIHNENGIHRHFEYSDMLKYVEGHVLPYARIV